MSYNSELDANNVELQEILDAVNNLPSIEDVVSSLDKIPSYWETALKEGARGINEKLCTAGVNKSAFLFYSDAHWDYGSQMSPRLLKYLYKHTGMTKTFFGGDIVNNEASDYETMNYIWDWRNQLKDLPNHHSVVGNHDDGNATNNLFTEQYVYGYLFAAEETYDMVMGDGLYYYIDNPAEKTRYICLDTAFQTSEEKQTQMLSFLTEALKSTKSGWHIVVVSHIWYLPDYNQYDVKPIPIVGMSTEATAVCAVLDNYNARSGDFTDCGAKVEFCIGGHVHRDYVGTTTGGISIILVETDSQHIRSEFTYTAGTTTESSVNGVVADYNTNKVNIVRVGRGNSFAVDLSSGGTSDPDEPDTPAYTNLFVKSEAHDDYRLNSSGILTASSGDLVTGFIPVQSNTSYTIRTRNLTDPEKGVIGRLSEYSAANESNHVTQHRPSESADKYWEDGVTFCFPFTTSATTKFIRLNMITGKGCDFIITLNEPIPLE